MSDIELSELDKKIRDSMLIGTIGSPSSTNEVGIDILASAVEKKLVGEFAIFKFIQDDYPHYALGQITEIALRNVWLEDPTIRSVARQKGHVNPISGKQDNHIGKMVSSAIFSRSLTGEYESSIMGNVPPTGTSIGMVNDEIFDTILRKYEKKLFYLGNVYRSKTKLPLWFRHFGSPPDGAGEAYHLGIFGSTGSGKSTLAKMIVSAYSAHPEMSIFIIDPVGEFSKNVVGTGSPTMSFNLDLRMLLQSNEKEISAFNITNIQLDTWDLFIFLVRYSHILDMLSITQNQNKERAIEVIREFFDGAEIRLEDLHLRETYDVLLTHLSEEVIATRIFSTPSPRNRFLERLRTLDHNHFFSNQWSQVSNLFRRREGSVRISELVSRAFRDKGNVIVIDLSGESIRRAHIDFDENIQYLIINRILDMIIWQGNDAWQNDRFLNTLVILDEAHRFASNTKFDNDQRERVRTRLLDAVRTTRKYGLGWMFISTSLSSIHKDILQQLRIIFFGFGLSMGNDFDTLRDLIGDTKALNLYQTFNDPASSLDVGSKQFSFMTKGPVSPLSFAGTPLLFNVFNDPNKFLKENGLRYGNHKTIDDTNYGF